MLITLKILIILLYLGQLFDHDPHSRRGVLYIRWNGKWHEDNLIILYTYRAENFKYVYMTDL